MVVMPSRRAVALILTFWLATSAYVAYRDLWPVLFASGPPPVAIDLADEAAQTVPVRWQIYRGDQKIGRLVTQIRYVETDDTFRFTNEYKQLRLEVSGVAFVVPELTTVVRVTRGGDLREQSAEGKLEVYFGDTKVGDATAKVAGTVVNGQLRATCEVKAPFPFGNVSKELDPVPVPVGQPLNPLMPVNRLTGVKPGRRWVVHESDPLAAAINTLVREKLGEYGFKLPEEKREPLIGAVLSDPQNLDWHGQSVACRVIEYRREEVEARTWVRVADGKVLRQEAYKKGERLTIVRDE
jgi:hypothetical protein